MKEPMSARLIFRKVSNIVLISPVTCQMSTYQGSGPSQTLADKLGIKLTQSQPCSLPRIFRHKFNFLILSWIISLLINISIVATLVLMAESLQIKERLACAVNEPGFYRIISANYMYSSHLYLKIQK